MGEAAGENLTILNGKILSTKQSNFVFKFVIFINVFVYINVEKIYWKYSLTFISLHE